MSVAQASGCELQSMHDSDERIRQLQDSLDSALNQARLLRLELDAAALREGSAVMPPDHAAASRGHKRKRLHSALERLQEFIPEFFRKLVRPIYLTLFYYRLYPENRPAAARRHNVSPETGRGVLFAHSGYAPFLLFKQRLCGTLNVNCRVSTPDAIPGLVSVVLPVYKGEPYVAESIKSVLAQDYPNVELIIVDDGSAGGIPEILSHYEQDARVTVIRQPNRKLPAALNAGFARARGEFFTWTSDDNRMHPGMLTAMVAFLQSRSDVEMVYGDEELIDEDGGPVLDSDFCRPYQTPPGSNVLHRPDDPGELNFVQNNFIGGCFLYRAWAGRVVGCYTPDFFGFEDYDYWLRMNALFRIAHLGIRRPLYSYRLHPASLTAREKELRIAERAGYFLTAEQERRERFAAGFDITFLGAHPWFRHLEGAWRQAGHNVLHIDDVTDESLYRYRVTRAFAKAIVIAPGCIPPSLTEPVHGVVTAKLAGKRLSMAGIELIASAPEALEYPLLAAANSLVWRADKCPEVP